MAAAPSPPSPPPIPSRLPERAKSVLCESERACLKRTTINAHQKCEVCNAFYQICYQCAMDDCYFDPFRKRRPLLCQWCKRSTLEPEITFNVTSRPPGEFDAVIAAALAKLPAEKNWWEER